MRHCSTARALALAGALALCLAAPGIAAARTLDYWVAAVPTSWSIVPNGHDAIMGMPVALEDSVFPTVVYRRFTPHWRRAEANAPRASADGLAIPGPLIHARVGDRLRIHFKNLDTLRHDPHSMHFHGVHYRPSSDGAYVPGVSGGDAEVKVGHTWTYRLTAGEDSAGVWPYHDHSPSMHHSIDGGMFGMLSILGRHERAPDQRVPGRLLAVRQVHGDRRPRVRRQHARLPLDRRPADPVGRDGDGLRLPHLPRSRPPLDAAPTAARATRRRSARPRATASAGARRIPAPGSTTATSRTT